LSLKTNDKEQLNEETISDILENNIRETMPEILDILLIDRTTSKSNSRKNIIWANDNYSKYDAKQYAPTAQIKPNLITGIMGHLIMPRALKDKQLQKERTKSKAEVFTPTWIVKLQNDEIDKNYQEDDLETYIKRTWLEITCGEAPYMATRYDMETGDIIPLEERQGFVDRKLSRINAEITDKAEWQKLVELAYKSSYGYEWNGDSLLLARENLLYTYRDYYFVKWEEEPKYRLFKDIAEIISYNVFQMDGLKFIIPLTEHKVKKEVELTLDFGLGDDVFSGVTLEENPEEAGWETVPGKPVMIMNWETNKRERFDKGVV